MSVVYGIPFQDPRTAAKLRVVLHIANAMMIVALCSFILQIIANYWSPVSGLIIAIFIPLCGVFGAKYASRGLIACFVFSNIAVLSYWLVITIIAWGDVNPQPYGGAAYAAFALSALMAALQLAGAIYGARLLGDKYFAEGRVPVAQPVVGIGGGVPVQPAGEYVVAHAVILSPPPQPAAVPVYAYPPQGQQYPPPGQAGGYGHPYGPPQPYGQSPPPPQTYGSGYAGYATQQPLQQPTLHAAGGPRTSPPPPGAGDQGYGYGSGYGKGEAAAAPAAGAAPGRQRTASAGAPPVAVPPPAGGGDASSRGASAPQGQGGNAAARARNSSV